MIDPMKVLILDGFGGDGNSSWIPWLRGVLLSKWYEVKNPNLPANKKDNCNIKEDIDFVLGEYGSWIENNIIIIAWSLWAVLALSLIQESWKKVRLILVTPAYYGMDGNFAIKNSRRFIKHEKILNPYRNSSVYNYDMLNKNILSLSILLSDTDLYIPYEEAKDYFISHFPSATIQTIHRWHCNYEIWCSELPEILDYIHINESFEVSDAQWVVEYILQDGIITETYRKKWPRASRNDKKTIMRDSICWIIVHPDNDKILLAFWKTCDWILFPWGGIDDSEKPLDAIYREIREETGYEDFISVDLLAHPIKKNYYHEPKWYNISWTDQAALIQLWSLKQQGVDDNERNKHEMIWIARSKVMEMLTSPFHRIYRYRYLHSDRSLDEVDKEFIALW